jgi:hypothetical protein
MGISAIADDSRTLRLTMHLGRCAVFFQPLMLPDHQRRKTRMRNRPNRWPAVVGVRLDRDVLNGLEAAAKRDRRPLANLLRKILSDWAEAEKPRSTRRRRAAGDEAVPAA